MIPSILLGRKLTALSGKKDISPVLHGITSLEVICRNGNISPSFEAKEKMCSIYGPVMDPSNSISFKVNIIIYILCILYYIIYLRVDKLQLKFLINLPKVQVTVPVWDIARV